MMRLMQKVSTRTLTMSCFFITLLVAFFGFFVINGFVKLHHTSKTIYDHPFTVSTSALDAVLSVSKMRSNTRVFALAKSSNEKDKALNAISEEERNVYLQLDIIRGHILGEQGKILENQARQTFENWTPVRKEILQLIQSSGKQKAIQRVRFKGAVLITKFEREMLALTSYSKENATVLMNSAEKNHSDRSRNAIGAGLLILLLSLLISAIAIRRVQQAEQVLLDKNELLKKSKRLLKEAQEIAKIGHWEFDIESNTLLWSDEIFRIFDVEPEEFQSTFEGLLERIHPEDRKLVEQAYLVSVDNKTPYNINHRIVLKNGVEKWVNERGTTHYNDAGKPMSSVGVVQDITESKRAEKALAESEAMFRGMFNDHSATMLLIVPETGQIVTANQSATQYYGYPLEEMIQMKIQQLNVVVPSGIAEDMGEAFSTHVNVFEFRHLLADGQVRDVEVYSTPITIQNQILLFSIIHDITDRKRAEEAREKLQAQLIQLEKTESLGLMAGSIAHTFNNQMAVVIGNLEFVLEDMPPQDVASIENVTAAIRGAHKAAEVSSLMLTYLGQTTGKYISMDLFETCRQSVSSLQTSVLKEITLTVDFLPPNPVIKGDEVQIQQVLVNLISNACEAMKEQGTIDVIGKTLPGADISPMFYFPPDWKPENETYACLEIRDTGCGIAAKDIDKIFDPFFSSKFTGRGLGLAVVLGIVKAHGGAVAVDSEPGEGSSFKVYLPVVAESVTQQPEKMIRASGMKTGGTVLLVEDDEMIRKMTTSMLTRMEFKVIEAIDGVDAVEIFQKYQDEIDVVISDLSMPRMDGWETMAALHQIRPNLPVILASGHGTSTVFAGDHLESPQDFLHKPYNKSALKESLLKAMSGSSLE